MKNFHRIFSLSQYFSIILFTSLDAGEKESYYITLLSLHWKQLLFGVVLTRIYGNTLKLKKCFDVRIAGWEDCEIFFENFFAQL